MIIKRREGMTGKMAETVKPQGRPNFQLQ